MTSPFPSPHLLAVKRYQAGADNEFGNATPTYGAPEEWWVRSIDPVSNREPGIENRDLATLALVVHADADSNAPGYRDLVTVDGVDYPVDGRPDDYSRGPWANPAAGIVVFLRRVEG